MRTDYQLMSRNLLEMLELTSEQDELMSNTECKKKNCCKKYKKGKRHCGSCPKK